MELDLEDAIATQALQDLMIKLTGDYENEFESMDVEQIKDMTERFAINLSKLYVRI